MNQFVERLRAFFRGGNGMRLVVVLGIAGLALILFSELLPKKTASDVPPEPVSPTDSAAYEETLTRELTRMLSSLRGVGRAEVLVSLSGTETQVFAKESDVEQDERGARTELRYVLVGGGSGQSGLVESVLRPRVSGVVIACEGGDSSVVREQVVRAVTVACGVSATQVFVGALH